MNYNPDKISKLGHDELVNLTRLSNRVFDNDFQRQLHLLENYVITNPNSPESVPFKFIFFGSYKDRQTGENMLKIDILEQFLYRYLNYDRNSYISHFSVFKLACIGHYNGDIKLLSDSDKEIKEWIIKRTIQNRHTPITQSRSKIYIGAKNMRGKWAPKPYNDIAIVDVTSAQSKTSQNRLTFSPMTPIPGGYKGYWNFEHYWQSGKVIQGVDRNKQLNWWKNQTQAKRRYPGSKDKTVLYAQWPEYQNMQMDYVTSRRKVYIPEYYNIIKNAPRLKELQNLYFSGKELMIYDFDGPRDNNGDPIAQEVTLELLKGKIADVRYPFGHGYIVAATIMGYIHEDYIN